MIKVLRIQSEPEALRLANSTVSGEKQRAIDHFEVKSKKETFPFEVYSKVKDELILLFSKKCAYCESVISHTQFVDVDHWRPKGSVRECKSHRGYYWLASEWDNLLPSCEICNRSYKNDRFPIEDGSNYALISTDNIIYEKPLLIHPCNDNPEDHLYFNEEGIALALDNSHKGETSITVYGLNREDLKIARKKIIRKMTRCLDWIQIEIDSHKGSPGEVNLLFKRLNYWLDEIELYTKADSDYSAATKCIISQYRQSSVCPVFRQVTRRLENQKVIVKIS